MRLPKSIFIIISLCVCTYGFSQTDTASYTLKVRLTKALPYPPNCGVFAWALTQKFQVIESNMIDLPTGSFILLNQACPEFLGSNFFGTEKSYKTTVSKKSEASFGYQIINDYQNEKLPVWWIRKIESISN